MKQLFLFIRPPRPLWPFNGPGSAFWPPLAFASLAAALREATPDLRVRILDAPALQMGWRSLEAELRRDPPHYVGIGEEAVSCVEGLRLAAIAKTLGARVIAGGCFFGNVAPEVLATGLIDAVVHGEGEETLVELLGAMRSSRPVTLSQVPGISFLLDGSPIATNPRQPLEDLDRLPFPAYDLLPMECYGRGSRNHPQLAALELSRGCTCGCEFCVLWRQMGRFRGAVPLPHLRVKSADRILDEIRVLTHKFGRRYLGWVDPCFNAHPLVPGQVAERLLREDLRIGQSAWVRADCLIRDAASGALKTCVEGGLNEVYLGIERFDRAGLETFKKQRNFSEVREALRMLAADFPEVLRIGSFIYGLPGDTPALVRSMYRLAQEIDLDIAFYIPLTPLPGTPYWRPEDWDSTGAFFRSFDFLPRLNGDPRLAALARTLYLCSILSWPPSKWRWLLGGLLSPNARRRSILRRHSIRILRYFAEGVARSFFPATKTGNLRIPRWYNT
jgi:anaerobic magnesium-protoporphyrin IX monomethyl ester cyclase